jgi:hypothetical protein
MCRVRLLGSIFLIENTMASIRCREAGGTLINEPLVHHAGEPTMPAGLWSLTDKPINK